MTLPASGPISIGMVAAELGLGLPLSLGDSRVRALAGVPSGPISLGQLRGKSAYTPMTLTTRGGEGGPASSETSGGAVSATATVSVAGGVAPFTIQWAVVSNPNNCTISGLNSSGANATKTFVKLSNGSASVTLNVTVTDSTGRSVSQSGVGINLYWGNSN